jgi:hypothetical protein
MGPVQNYPVRPSHRRNLELAAIATVAREHLESVVVDGGEVRASYGALEHLAVKPAGRELSVELRMNPKVPDTVARETIARYNRFLEAVTGYSSKERAKRLRKSAGE